MRVINGIMQRGEDWKLWRRQGLTATDAADLFRGGLGWLDVWMRKTGRAPEVDLSRNTHIARGVENEPEARRAAERDLNDILLPVCIEHDAEPVFRASLDGITSTDIPTELKCPGGKNWADLWLKGEASSVVEHYRPQLHHQILVADAPYALIYFYDVESQGVMRFRLDRDQAMLDRLITAGKTVWAHVLADTVPPLGPDGHLATPASNGEPVLVPSADEEPSWAATAEEWSLLKDKKSALRAEISAIEEREAGILAMLEQRMGDHRVAQGGGMLITRAYRKGSVDWKRMVEDLKVADSEREKYRREGSDVFSISTGKTATVKLAKLTTAA